MARSFVVVALIVSAFCFSSVLAARVAPNDDAPYDIVGEVYCDPCNDEFNTNLSKPLEGVKVCLVCTNGDKNVTYVKESTTNKDGFYCIPLRGDIHDDDVCKVKADNTKGTCTKILINESKEVIKKVNSDPSKIRRVETLLFGTGSVDPQCAKVIRRED